MVAPGKTERSWYLNPDTADALRFARLCVPKGMCYSEILALSTSLLFDEIRKICEEQDVSVGKAIEILFNDISDRNLTISITISSGDGKTDSETFSNNQRGNSQ